MSAEAKAIHRADGGDDKRSNAVADRLRATEEALRAAQALIADQEKRENELKKLLVGNGVALEAPVPARPTSKFLAAEDTQLQAMKAVHDNKVRALMKSIHQLQEQIQMLKTQDKEHRRSALIQNLRKSQGEQELLIDVLKQTLVEKVPEFQESRELVNDFIIKKSIGGPIRFRPPSREELENDLQILDGKYKRAVENLKKVKEESARMASERTQSQRVDDKGDDIRRETLPQRVVEKEVLVPDPAQADEIERLKIDLASKNLTIHSQADEIHELFAEIERLRVVEEKLERKKDKIAVLEEKMNKIQLETIKLVHEKESEVEKNEQLRGELQFLRDTRVEDVQASDSERLRQMELIRTLRVREVELQNEVEEQQKKWSIDRTNINTQMRLVEKEKELLEEQFRHLESEHVELQKRHDRIFIECDSLKEQLKSAHDEKAKVDTRVRELEDIIAQHESRTKEEQEIHAKTMSERLREMQEALAEKDELAKKLDRQLTASKLLARQAKKEKEQLQERLSKLLEAKGVEAKEAKDSQDG